MVTHVREPRTDLNLLHIVHAIIAEASITRAARRLSLTQPAVSNALRRARSLFQDELLVRSAAGMRPTERARAIWPQLDAALAELNALTRAPVFDPATSTLTFRVAITASLETVLVPPLIERVAREAPQAVLSLQMHTDARSTSDLEQGRLDCAIGMFPNPSEALRTRGVLRDDHVCVVRRGHPAPLPLSLEHFSAYRHILVTPSSRPTGIMDAWLEAHGARRDIAFIVSRYEDALRSVARTDLITVVPRLYATVCAEPGVVLTPLPFPAEPVLYKLLWHDRTDKVPAQIWLRGMLADHVRQSYAARGKKPQAAYL